MKDFTQDEGATANITDATIYSLQTVNCIPIFEDMKYFMKKSVERSVLDNEERYRNARAAIVYMAFFIESLACYIYEKHSIKKDNKNKKEGKFRLSKPIRMLRLAYKKELGEDIKLDLNRLQDIFFLRNNIFAHPKATTTRASNDPSLMTKYNYQYQVLKDPPNAYKDFKDSDAKTLYDEMNKLLKEYFALMNNRLPENLSSQIQFD